MRFSTFQHLVLDFSSPFVTHAQYTGSYVDDSGALERLVRNILIQTITVLRFYKTCRLLHLLGSAA